MPEDIHTGICKGGPKDGHVHTTMGGRTTTVPGHDEGMYVHKPASGPEPAAWLWVERKGTK